ncbi:M57 family metalloprotease [Flavobacterium sp. N1736]|uniref:M57 family metalloprotease n=1 Tax=Flavobacterium sp. N1736 TaxID=2986823 RepID=UPI0022248204|nr:M57 family metalloprotease [Flavobacterium sp. N1736]
MKNVKKITVMIAICLSQFFIQCSSDDNKGIEEKPIAEQYTDEIILLRNFLAESLHGDIEKIIYDSKENAFIIDKDVVMPLQQARDRYNESGFKNTNKITQQFNGNIMKPEMAASIQVYISSEVTSEWRIAINKAINTWNITNSGINITIVNASTSSTVNIIMVSLADRSVIADAYYPSGGKPGTRVRINTNFANKLNDTKRISTITHELGHTFGLSHTDGSFGSLIPCTPISDKSSIMHSTVNDYVDFSYFDDVAISTLYPVAVGTKKMYRYKKGEYFFYSTDACEITPGKDGYVFDGDVGYLYTTKVPGTVPLYRSISSKGGHSISKSKTSDEIILGYYYTSQLPGTTALYFFMAPTFNIYKIEYNHGGGKIITGFVLHKFLRNNKDDIIF